MKTCNRCGEAKPLDQYHRQTASRDGRRAECKTCVAQRARDRRERDPGIKERELARARARRDQGRHDGASPRIHAVQGCLYPGCQRGGTVQHLCPQHHHEVTKGSESPLALTEGRWERGVGGVRRWVA